jgi:hypothetical protein
MNAVLANGEEKQPVVRQSALDGLALLAPKVTGQRQAILQTLVATMEDRNPRLTKKSREVLESVYKATPTEIEKARQPHR